MFTALLIQFASQPLLGHPIRASLRPMVVAVNLVAAVAVTAIAIVLQRVFIYRRYECC
jgi:ABC-type proline/glycine betaine transport system permease subunit